MQAPAPVSATSVPVTVQLPLARRETGSPEDAAAPTAKVTLPAPSILKTVPAFDAPPDRVVPYSAPSLPRASGAKGSEPSAESNECRERKVPARSILKTVPWSWEPSATGYLHPSVGEDQTNCREPAARPRKRGS
jgi:hypothetical protein